MHHAAPTSLSCCYRPLKSKQARTVHTLRHILRRCCLSPHAGIRSEARPREQRPAMELRQHMPRDSHIVCTARTREPCARREMLESPLGMGPGRRAELSPGGARGPLHPGPRGLRETPAAALQPPSLWWRCVEASREPRAATSLGHCLWDSRRMAGCHSFGTQRKRIENAAETQEKPLNEEACRSRGKLTENPILSPRATLPRLGKPRETC